MLAKKISDEKKKKMIRIISEMRSRMDELNKLQKDIGSEKISLTESPKKTKAVLEEIKVPSLKLLKEEKHAGA